MQGKDFLRKIRKVASKFPGAGQLDRMLTRVIKFASFGFQNMVMEHI